MRNRKLYSWLCGIGLVLGLFGATEAMAQPQPKPGHSWLDKARHDNKVMKSAHKIHKERVKAAPGLDRPLPPPGDPRMDKPLPPPGDPRFEKKPLPPQAKGHKAGPHEKKGPGPKPHRK